MRFFFFFFRNGVSEADIKKRSLLISTQVTPARPGDGSRFEYRPHNFISPASAEGQLMAVVSGGGRPWCCGAGLRAVLASLPLPSAVAATCSIYSLSPYTHMSICLVFTGQESALRLPYQIRRPIPRRTPFMPPTRKSVSRSRINNSATV